MRLLIQWKSEILGPKKYVFVYDVHSDGAREVLDNVHAVYWGFAEDVQITMV